MMGALKSKLTIMKKERQKQLDKLSMNCQHVDEYIDVKRAKRVLGLQRR